MNFFLRFKKRIKKRHKAAAGVLAAVFFLFFVPFSWRLALPGEVRYEKQDRLIAVDNGYIFLTPREASRIYLPGQTIFELKDPLLLFARERVQYMLRYDRILFEQQRGVRQTIGDSLLTLRRIDSDIHAIKELDRKISGGKKNAPAKVIFIPELGNESKGFYVRSGTVLGKLCSGRLIVRAYADDQDIKYLRPGQKVRLFVKDRLAGVSGIVQKVYYIPVVLQDSPALASYGGEIPVGFDENDPDKPHSFQAMYFVDIVTEKALPFQCGRFVRAQISYQETVASRLWQLLLSALRREI